MNRLTDKGRARLVTLCKPPWEGDDENALRYRAEEDRKARDDREWCRRNDERSGAHFG